MITFDTAQQLAEYVNEANNFRPYYLEQEYIKMLESLYSVAPNKGEFLVTCVGENRKISAIKLHKLLTGSTLAESKKFVEENIAKKVTTSWFDGAVVDGFQVIGVKDIPLDIYKTLMCIDPIGGFSETFWKVSCGTKYIYALVQTNEQTGITYVYGYFVNDRGLTERVRNLAMVDNVLKLIN